MALRAPTPLNNEGYRENKQINLTETRITKGENYDVLMGSDESHEYIQQLIQKIEDELKARGMSLDDLTPEEFGEFLQSIK